MELFDLYTEDREKTGQTIPRGSRIPAGMYRLVVHVCIFDSKGRMLIQQRQLNKHGWPGYWDVSVGGCVIAGETSRQAAIRETNEELGLSINPGRSVATITFEDGFDDFYTVVRDVDLMDIHLQEEEVRAVRWATEEEIFDMIDAGTFIPYTKHKIRLLFYLKDGKGLFTRERA